MNNLTKIFAALGAMTTIVAAWEFTFKDRVLPYYVTSLSLCEADDDGFGTASKTKETVVELSHLLVKNASSAIYLDIDTIDVCERNGDELEFALDGARITDNTKTLSFTTEINEDFIGFATVKIHKKRFKSTSLSRIQDGASEFSGDRMLGIFFVRGNLNAGVFEIELADVGYSKALDDMHVCTRAVANANNFFDRTYNYVVTCVAGLKSGYFIDNY